MKQVKIVPSVLSADFGNLRGEVSAVVDAGCDLLHLDVMDGHFVPNITFGPMMVEMLRRSFTIPFDIHLMIEDPERFLSAFGKANNGVKGSIISVHQETCPHLHRTIEKIHALDEGILAGCSLNPGTPVSTLESVIKDLDMVMLMSVDPGFGGQSLIGSCLEKIDQIRELAAKKNHEVLIELDGGIKIDNLEKVKKADLLVMGSGVFKGQGPKAAGESFAKAQAAANALVR